MSRSPVVIFQKYGKPVLPFMNVCIFLLNYFQEQSKSWEPFQYWVLLFRRNLKQRKFAFHMTWLTPEIMRSWERSDSVVEC